MLVLASVIALHAQETPALGSAAPEFTLPATSGGALSLEKMKGEWVVLYFYPRNFTGGCTLEARNFQRDSLQYAERGALVVGVSTDSADSHRAFCDEEGLGFPLLSDVEGTVAARYGSLTRNGERLVALRNTFIISPDGKIAAVFTGVKPMEHSRQVLEELDRLIGAR